MERPMWRNPTKNSIEVSYYSLYDRDNRISH